MEKDPNQPSYAEIAELFGLTLPEDEVPLEEAEAEKPVRHATALERGDHFFNEGEYAKAIEEFREAVADSAGSQEAILKLAATLEIQDTLPAAMRQYRKALKAAKDNAFEPQLAIADIYRKHGRGREALEELNRAIELEPDNAYGHFRLAEAFLNYGYPNRAISAVHRALILAPDSWFYYFWLADAQIKVKAYDDAVESLRAAVELSPGDAHLYARTAIAFWGAGRHLDAIKAARLASDLVPANGAYIGLMEALMRREGQIEEANLAKKELDQYDQDQLDRWLAELDA